MKSVLAYAKKPVGAVMMRPVLKRLLELDGFRVHGSARLFGHVGGGRMFRDLGLEGIKLTPKWLARMLHYDLYLSADFIVSAPRALKRVHFFHGVSFRNHGVHENALKYDLLLVVGPYMLRRFRETGLITEQNAHRFPVIGMPKLDDLVNGRYSREEVLSRLELDPGLPCVLYAPTWSKKVSSLEQEGEELIDQLRKSGKNVIVKLHDNSLDARKAGRNWRGLLGSIQDPRFRFVESADVVPLMSAADLLVSDASSVANEFTLLDRPILFMEIEDLKSRLKPKADLDTWGRKAGEVVPSPSKLNAAIDAALSDPGRQSEIRQALARDLFHDPGGATGRALSAILDLVPG
ncbi:MAG: CDP-glycerol glycerophosphotransferase family protein [Planctomycetota bacterium]